MPGHKEGPAGFGNATAERIARAEKALKLLKDPKYKWVITQKILDELRRGDPTSVALRDAFIKKYNIDVKSPAEMAQIESGSTYQDVFNELMRRGPKHQLDIEHAASAAEMGLPYLSDTKFMNFVENAVESLSKRSTPPSYLDMLRKVKDVNKFHEAVQP
ncbi:MAG: hypothetical protein ACRD22_06440 [Terriglobia bacterium]